MRKGAQYGTVTIFTGWKSLGIFLLLFLLAFVSCIKEDSEVCPPLQVNIIVKDKIILTLAMCRWRPVRVKHSLSASIFLRYIMSCVMPKPVVL